MSIFEYIIYGLISICLLIMLIFSLAGIRLTILYLNQENNNKKEGKK